MTNIRPLALFLALPGILSLCACRDADQTTSPTVQSTEDGKGSRDADQTTNPTLKNTEAGMGLRGGLVDSAGGLLSDNIDKVVAVASSDTGFHGLLSVADLAQGDSAKRYSFPKLPSGTYDLYAMIIEASSIYPALFRAGVRYDSMSNGLDLGIDTLWKHSSIYGQVTLRGAGALGAVCSIDLPPTRLTTDGSGRFLFDWLNPGEHHIRCTVCVPPISWDTTIDVGFWNERSLPPKAMDGDTNFNPPTPTGLSAEYDSVTGTLRVHWKRVDVPDLAGYRVYYSLAKAERVAGEEVWKHEVLASSGLSGDTQFIDTAFPIVLRKASRKIGVSGDSYQIPDSANVGVWVEAVDSDSNKSGADSDSILMLHPMPPMSVQTLIDLHFAGPDSQSCGDPIKLELGFSNPVFPPKAIGWNYRPFVNGSSDKSYNYQSHSGFTSPSGTDTFEIQKRGPFDSMLVYVSYQDHFNGIVSLERGAKASQDGCFRFTPVAK